jgi:hypothetical protein
LEVVAAGLSAGAGAVFLPNEAPHPQLWVQASIGIARWDFRWNPLDAISVVYRRTLANQGVLNEVSVRFELGLGLVMTLLSPV